jgi:N utilization substance protein A
VSVDVEALKILAEQKQIPLERLISAIENEVAKVYTELPSAKPNGRAVLNRQSGELVIYVPVFGPDGDRIDTTTDNPVGFAKLADKTARKVIKEKMRQAKDLEVVTEFSGSVGDVIGGIVQQGRDADLIYVSLGKVEGKVPPAEQVKGEVYKHGDRIKCFVVDVKQGEKGPEITLSRTHPAFVKMLFALEVPEIKNRVVDIVGIVREPGARTKLSVRTHRAGVSAKGALIGPQGARAQNVRNELNGEKIDIIDYSDDPATYVANALAPARVSSVEIVDLESKSAKVIVPDYQLSLAIGKDGQNARLASRLTQWRIDIHPDNPVAQIKAEKAEPAPNISPTQGA